MREWALTVGYVSGFSVYVLSHINVNLENNSVRSGVLFERNKLVDEKRREERERREEDRLYQALSAFTFQPPPP